MSLEAWDFADLTRKPEFYYEDSSMPQFTYQSLFPSWNGAQKYGVSFWAKRMFPSDPDLWYTTFRISNDAE